MMIMMILMMMMIMMMIGQYKTTQADTDPLVCAGRDINVHDRGLTLINKFGQIIEISRNHNWKTPHSYLYLVSCIMYHVWAWYWIGKDCVECSGIINWSRVFVCLILLLVFFSLHLLAFFSIFWLFFHLLTFSSIFWIGISAIGWVSSLTNAGNRASQSPESDLHTKTSSR